VTPTLGMQLVKPGWVKHDGFPILSCDIHPDGKRFATGGGDNKIKIWNLDATFADEEIETVPRLLCALENHCSPVNVVRWSPNGRYLATGSDDRVIIIWELMSGVKPTLLFGSDEKIVESWRCVVQFRGHTAGVCLIDVTDLAWSPTNKNSWYPAVWTIW